MKYFFTTICILAFKTLLYAQSDTSAYNVQRAKINNLLAQRSERFGQYDNSLTRRSGIFGLKTKRDMQASNDILTQIVLTDNQIFTELKVLLDYKDFEKKEVETRAESVESRINRFQLTIKNLQQENDRLKTGIEHEKKKNSKLLIYSLILLALTLFIAFLPWLKKLRNADKVINKD